MKNGKATRIEKNWSSAIYVGSDSKKKLEKLEWNQSITPYARDISWVNRFEQVSDAKKSSVLKLTLKRSENALYLAKKISQLERFGVLRLYNVDVPPEQTFFYENDIFPLGKYKHTQNKWIALSSIKETDYTIPKFSQLNLTIVPHKKQKLPQFSDKIKLIQINNDTIESNSEEQMILDCIEFVRKQDPDFIFTQHGDSWDFPYLIHRASQNKISQKLILGRENTPILTSKNPGNSYYSYGQVHYKPSAIKLYGRIHIDKSNCFLWNDKNSIEGIYEIARTCRLPLQTAARASIGKCMSSVQFHHATKRKLLIPWRPIITEILKSRMKLLIGDRGGLILEPQIGLHENVAGIDFASLFGNIMLKKNISAETINCKCCPDSENIVPELHYHICKKKGIVPYSLKLLLDKRESYTKLIETVENNIEIYKTRKAALKWILVTSFGYLGFNNAKFGRIDAHMAVCAFARDLLLRSMKIAENNGYTVLHGIVDSLWIYKKNAKKNDYVKIKKIIEKETGFDMSLDLYRWIVFLPSKESKIVPVPNRYFGTLDNGEIKIRGIEARRHDTPKFFKECQLEILNLFSKCHTVLEITKAIPKAKLIQNTYEKKLANYQVSLNELVFTNRVTRGTGEHRSKTIQADAVNQLKWEGTSIAAGQKIQYVIHDFSRRISKRVVPIEITKSDDSYDVARYSELLKECCKSVIEPFEGYRNN